MEGRVIYPGFIDAHCHFLGYGKSTFDVDLVGTVSFDEVIERTVAHSKKYPNGNWITGRGWDQNDWEVKDFPDNDRLNQLFPERPVFIKRIAGHAALVNKKAFEIAGISKDTTVDGGRLEIRNGQLTGLLLDNAIGLVGDAIPDPSEQDIIRFLLKAQEDCFAVGLTTVDDAGLDKSEIDIIDSLQKEGSLKMRVYAMINPEDDNKRHYFENGPYKTDRLNVRSFKLYADGALGSRGARLMAAYTDEIGHFGFFLHDSAYYRQWSTDLYQNGFQMNTHCIGDAANRLILDIYAEVLPPANDRRWRIEHAQVVHQAEFVKFGLYRIIPSAQPTHCTSDMAWAPDRLGTYRILGAYAYKKLLDQNQMLASGSDFPVEDINPIYGFFSAVARQDHNFSPDEGFQMENALSREEALKAMTIWAAYANFEEKERGSIEDGKFADFVVLDNDIMKVPLEDVLAVKVLMTFLNGEKVYEQGKDLEL